MSTRSNAKINTKEEELQSVVKTLVLKMCSSEDFINHITNSIVSTITEKFSSKIEKLEAENSKLTRNIKDLENLIDMNNDVINKKHNKSSLRVFGITETKNENCMDVVIDLLNKKIGVNITKLNIDVCHRVGKYDKKKSRPIFIKFVQFEIKREIYSLKKKLKGSGVVIREELTKNGLQLVKEAIKILGKDGNVWTKDGNIFGKKGGSILHITSINDLI